MTYSTTNTFLKTIIITLWLFSGPMHSVLAQSSDSSNQVDLFTSGEQGYGSYRIPAILTTPSGTLLAFCEGREEAGDAGDIDLLLKRSTDQGKTWSEQQVVWNDGANTCGNPCPVVDEETGTIWLVMTHNLGDDGESEIIRKEAESTRTVWVCSSEDDGKSWSEPKEITSTTKDPEWGWYATGPGVGIQIKHGPHKGRLVIPSDHSYDDPNGKVRNGPYEYGSHAIYSDDHGQTWQLGGVIRPKVNECQMVELADGNGTLMMDMRSYFGRNRRAHAISYDGGQTWTDPADAEALVEPVCQASILRYQWPEGDQKSKILFLNPASADNGKRHNLTLRMSYDEGKTWPGIRTIFPGPSAYSSLTRLTNGNIGLLYEAGEESAYEKIIFQVVEESIFE
uniref:exo-alpha-sialidase n=1 Tax=Roseihalotalea indica TaxID=2867963 RepID=A0AA49GNV0_9BACT|nr:sialidase family protein [Tunicatimonas sp. TK19036]